jgi:hypothetical protein
MTTLTDLGFASIAAGVLARRRSAVRLLERSQADARSLKRMRMLRRKFGRGPVELVIPGRRFIVVLDPDDVGRVLNEAPTPFHPANLEKCKALQWFQPHGVLISQGRIRDARRAVNEAALETASDLHHLSEDFTAVIAAEARQLIADTLERGQLDSSQFMTAWWRMVRRLTLGTRARDDDEITAQLLRLRRAGNWAFLSLPHYRKRAQFLEHLQRYAETPEPGTLMSAVTDTRAGAAVDAVGQIPQWLFAFDAAGMATMRALALLASHPEDLTRALDDAADPERPGLRPYQRASLLESVRIWPTTPTLFARHHRGHGLGRGAGPVHHRQGGGSDDCGPAVPSR